MKKKLLSPAVLILAGGKGERFWPRSREKTPKQLQKVYSSKTLLEETLIRARSITGISHIYIGCNAALKKAILATHKGLTDHNFIVEPEGKNTAPIIALAALEMEKRHPGSVQVILSADHFISTIEDFKKTINTAVASAEEGHLVTLGIRPTRPETGYGYIESGKRGKLYFSITSFKEKPDVKQALNYINSGKYYWNSGIFIWKGSVILSEFESHAPHIMDPIRQADKKGQKALASAFKKIKSDPVDIAILEKSKNIVMVPAEFVWDDVGSWISLERICEKDSNDNVFLGDKKSRFASRNSSHNVISSSKGLVAMLGVNNLILVEDGDVLYVASRENAGDIKELLGDLRKNPALQKYLL